MKEFLTYQFEVSICILIFYLFYGLILRDDTGFTLKRIYFLFSCFVSFLIPSLSFDFQKHNEYVDIPVQILTYIPQNIEPLAVDSGLSIWSFLFYVWGLGCLLMTIRIFYSLSQTTRIIGRAIYSENGSYKITDEDTQSFSFFRWIIVHRESVNRDSLSYVLHHERVHVNQYHSIDILVFEVVKIFQWFNPVIWLYGKYLIRNLEHIADREVINGTHNKQDYQRTLIQEASMSFNNVLNIGFSKAQLKKRIMMMNIKGKKTSKIRWILTIPLVGLVFMSFTLKISNAPLNDEVSNYISNIIAPLPFEEPISILPIDSLKDVKNNNPKILKEVEPAFSKEVLPKENRILKPDTIAGRVINEEGKHIAGATIMMGTLGTVSDIEGRFSLITEEKNNYMSIAAKNYASKKVDIDSKSNLSIVLKYADDIPAIDSSASLEFKKAKRDSVNIRAASRQDSILYIIDGIEYLGMEGNNYMFKLSKEEKIKSIKGSPKGGELYSRYGGKDNNAVIVVTLKD